jgi:orotate phosphoribosyltransferase
LTEFLELVSARQGHFQLESGHHSALWLDLDPLFADPRKIDGIVAALTDKIRRYDVDAVCGPLLGGALLGLLVAKSLGVNFAFTERSVPPDSAGLFRASYILPTSFTQLVRGKRIAIVDDVMSAGSALRGTFAELQSKGATPVVTGALLVLGSTGADFFAANQIPVEAVERREYELWHPSHCPLCARGLHLENVARIDDDSLASPASAPALTQSVTFHGA